MEQLQLDIEALIFSSHQPLSVQEIIECLNSMHHTSYELEKIERLILQIDERYQSPDFAFQLKKTAGGYQFLSKQQYYKLINQLINQKSKKRLSTSALETLSIIAYKAPVTKAEIEQVRGVNCDYAVQKLLEKDLVEIVGKKDAPGRPLLYELSQTFLDYFGINSAEELPQLKDVVPEEGEA